MNIENTPIVYWIRSDLRMSDNIALSEAIKTNKKIIIIYLNNYLSKKKNSICAQDIWTNKSINELSARYKKNFDIEIIQSDINPKLFFSHIYQLFSVREVHYNKIYEPEVIKKDLNLEKYFKDKIVFHSYNSSLLFDPLEIKNNSGSYFKVFTPYWRNCSHKLLLRTPIQAPNKINVFRSKKLKNDNIKSNIKQNAYWEKKILNHFIPGEIAARKQISNLLQLIKGYSVKRDYPNDDKTSKFSAYLARGELSVNEVMYQLMQKKKKINTNDYNKFSTQLGWREFSYSILNNFPKLPTNNFNCKFDNFKWEKNDFLFKKWTLGLTGYPIVDAGMRELWKTGYMHNRLRMIVASFLIKDLMIDWRLGREWFEKTLFDHDLANNSSGWQWVAGSGTDAAPYFRIFNPILQSERFDKDGNYIKRWVPELALLNNKYIHAPWTADKKILIDSGIDLGVTYPMPIVDHKKARDEALKRYKLLR